MRWNLVTLTGDWRSIECIAAFVIGVVLIPIGLSAWFSLPVPGTLEYTRTEEFRKLIGPTLYLFGFYFLVVVWYFATKPSMRILLGFTVLSIALTVAGMLLDTTYRTYIYEPLTRAGLGLFVGTFYSILWGLIRHQPRK